MGNYNHEYAKYFFNKCLLYLILSAVGPKSMSISQLSQLSMLSEEAEQAIIVVAEESGKAILPCNITRAVNDTIDLILWFRGDAETALYSLDARKAPIQRAKHFLSDDLSARAYIDITSRPTSLVVESVKGIDRGEYKCRVDFRKGRTQYRTIHLDVIVHPKELIIMDEFGQKLRDQVGPYNEGAHLTLICEAEGGKPRPLLYWFWDSKLIDDSWTVTAQGIVRNELVITRLLRNHHKSTLKCEATNSNLTKPVTNSITLELNLRPLDVKIVTLERPLLADRKIEIVCESHGSRPPALITWWKGSKRLVHTTEDIGKTENITINTVYFMPSIEDNGKILSCRADHAILPDSALEDTWVLDIYYSPRVTVSLGATIHDSMVREGSNVSFECHVHANPPVTQIGWKYEGQTITQNSDSNNVLIGENSLVISSVTRFDSGKYSCVAANAEGEGESDTIHLNILYAPICKPNQRRIYGVAKREPIQVPCDVDADPPQVSFRWTFNNSHEVITVKKFISAKTRSIATHEPKSKYGYGELYCWARNKVGEQREPCIFTVIPAGAPQPVKNCLVGNQSTDSLVVKCEQGEDGGLEQLFYLEIYQSERGLLQSNWSSTKAPIFEVTSLPIATQFVLVLYAANPKGRSNYVTLTTNTMPFYSAQNEIGFKPVIYLLIAIVGSLVITATAIMSITKFRTNKAITGKTLENASIRTESTKQLSPNSSSHQLSQPNQTEIESLANDYVKQLYAISESDGSAHKTGLSSHYGCYGSPLVVVNQNGFNANTAHNNTAHYKSYVCDAITCNTHTHSQLQSHHHPRDIIFQPSNIVTQI